MGENFLSTSMFLATYALVRLLGFHAGIVGDLAAGSVLFLFIFSLFEVLNKRKSKVKRMGEN